MDSEFFNLFITFEKDKLFDIILHPEKYQSNAVSTAKKIILKKGWGEDLEIMIEQRNERKLELEQEENLEYIEKAAYYKRAVEFKAQNNSLQVKTSDIVRLESALESNNIDFYFEEKNMGVQLDYFPAHTYYFKNEDMQAVDEVTRKIQLVSAQFRDDKSFFKFELKAGLIAFFVFALIILIIIFF